MIFRMTVLLLFVGQRLRANVRSHSSLASSSRSRGPCFPSSIEKHSTTLTRKNFSDLAHLGKQEPETFTGNLRGEVALCTACHFFIAMTTYNMGYPSYVSMSRRIHPTSGNRNHSG